MCPVVSAVLGCLQAISDSTTLPQMVEELAQHLNSASNVDALVLQLRCGALLRPSLTLLTIRRKAHRVP